ncbi:histone acetyltransferases subunit 3-domain-containing protein [Auriculariales sp. MPI-PUGE-AT-0066]|nr:histone acetyltransferases subunit 3-domain-containing protein [Auriculariales sp. MPI-PUGE-AT-0066]
MANADSRIERQQWTKFPHPERSSLLTRHSNAVDRLPAAEDIGALENELKRFQQLAAHRISTADANLAALDRLAKRMNDKRQDKLTTAARSKANLKERERDKARRAANVVSSTRAPSSAPSEVGDGTVMDPISLNGSTPVASTSAAAARPPKNLGSLDGSHSKDRKKKRRRESQGLDEEDADMLPPPAQKPRKASPTPSHQSQNPANSNHAPQNHNTAHHGASSNAHKSKSGSGQVKVNSAGFRIAEDFNLPNKSYVPARPKMFPPLPPGPREVTDVNDDFTQWKQPSKQEPVHIFHGMVEPYMRPIREEDLALLDFNGDPEDPFLIPALGRHYLEVWEDEDAAFEGRDPRPGVAPSRPTAPPPTSWNQGQMNETDMTSEQHGFGPLVERLVSALLPMNQVGSDPDPAVAAGLDPWKGEAKAPTLTSAELEERYLKELQTLGLLLPEDEFDLSHPEDDQIVSELRTCQRLLRDQMSINQQRKARLLALAEDRVAYQDYLDSKESMERNLLAMYQKQQKPRITAPPVNKKKKQVKTDEPAGPQPHPAGTGFTLTTDGHLHVPATMKKLVDTRNRFVDAVTPGLAAREREEPGTYWSLPPTSIYESLNLPKDPDPGKRAGR